MKNVWCGHQERGQVEDKNTRNQKLCNEQENINSRYGKRKGRT